MTDHPDTSPPSPFPHKPNGAPIQSLVQSQRHIADSDDTTEHTTILPEGFGFAQAQARIISDVQSLHDEAKYTSAGLVQSPIDQSMNNSFISSPIDRQSSDSVQPAGF